MEQDLVRQRALAKYRQEKPFTILIEPTEGCNLGYWFCGLRGMREKGTKPYFYMETDTAERIASCYITRTGISAPVMAVLTAL